MMGQTPEEQRILSDGRSQLRILMWVEYVKEYGGLCGGLLQCTLWIIVFAKADPEVFFALGAGEYYTISEVWTYGLSVSLGLGLFARCCINDAAGRLIHGIGGLIFGTTNLVLMCIIMYKDPEHNFLVYSSFWHEWAFNYNRLDHANSSLPPHASTLHPSTMPTRPTITWPYDMADVLVRIGWGVFVLAFVYAFSFMVSFLCIRCVKSLTSNAAAPRSQDPRFPFGPYQYTQF